MKKRKFIRLILSIGAIVIMATGCSRTTNVSSDIAEDPVEDLTVEEKAGEVEPNNEEENQTVVIEDIHGQVEVDTNPEVVVALDNRTFETLDDWGIDLAVAPKTLIPDTITYAKDESVLDLGNHKEPDLELIAAVDPDLVIIGQRFASFEEDIRQLVPDAQIINLNFDVSDETDKQAENFVEGFKNSTIALGLIFDKEAEAKALIDDFESSIDKVKEAYNPEETIMSVVVSGGEIGFSAPGSGRVWGPMYEIFGWKPALELDDASSDHKGDDISVEAIAQSNPDWILVLDRDAATVKDESSTPAKDVIEGSQALANTDAIKESKLIYAPNDTYTNESIQTYIELFNSMAEEFSK